jgi:phosphate transport system permease protein
VSGGSILSPEQKQEKNLKDNKNTPIWLKASALYVSSIMSALFVFITLCALDGLVRSCPSLFGSVWNPLGGQFGIMPMIWASGLLSLSSLAMGWAFSVGCCCYIHGFGPKWAARLLAGILRIMTAVPTVVYGFASVFLLVPLIRNGLGGSGFSWLTASLVLSLLIIPTMVLSMDSAFRTIESETRLTSAALGFTREQNMAMVVIPASKEWIWSSALLGFGRAAGDTLIPTMLAGNAVQYANTPLDAMRTLTAHIGLVLSSDVGGTAYLSLFVAGGILLFVSITANMLFRLVRRKSL